MRVDVEHVLKMQAERFRINSLNLKEIEWYEDGKKIEISPELIEEFLFTGLCNIDFITTESFKKKNLYEKIMKKLIKWLRDKHIVHTWIECGTQQIKGILFGSGGAELPSQRVVYQCAKCPKKKYLFLNLSTPYEYRYNREDLWK